MNVIREKEILKVSILLAILFPDIIDYRYSNNNNIGNKEVTKRNSKPNELLSCTIDQIGKDLLEIKVIGGEHAILNFNRSPISNNIDDIIDISKQLSRFVR
jgi:hypothetical protein